MENPKNIKTPGQTPAVPTDKGEDSEERRDAAEQAWRDKQGIPRGTPEQGEERSADSVGGDGAFQPKPEIDDDQADKRRASTDDETEND
jgi:hypothetical protein